MALKKYERKAIKYSRDQWLSYDDSFRAWKKIVTHPEFQLLGFIPQAWGLVDSLTV